MLARVSVPVLGIIENMADFTNANGEIVDIFGAGRGAKLA